MAYFVDRRCLLNLRCPQERPAKVASRVEVDCSRARGLDFDPGPCCSAAVAETRPRLLPWAVAGIAGPVGFAAAAKLEAAAGSTLPAPCAHFLGRLNQAEDGPWLHLSADFAGATSERTRSIPSVPVEGEWRWGCAPDPWSCRFGYLFEKQNSPLLFKCGSKLIRKSCTVLPDQVKIPFKFDIEIKEGYGFCVIAGQQFKCTLKVCLHVKS